MQYILAKVLAKAAAFTYPQKKDPAEMCPQLESILVSKVWIQSTNRVSAFRAPGLLHFEGYMKLTSKLTKARTPRALPKTANEVRFPDDITEDNAPEAPIVNAKGVEVGKLGDFFGVELFWERPKFPDLDRVFPKTESKKPSPKFAFDLALFSRLMAGEDPTGQINVEAWIGEGELSPTLIRNFDVADRCDQWEAVIMPVRP